MSKQLTLFGTRAVCWESYVVYCNPTRDYKSFIERHCLRARQDKGYVTNQKFVCEAQSMWTNFWYINLNSWFKNKHVHVKHSSDSVKNYTTEKDALKHHFLSLTRTDVFAEERNGIFFA